MDATRDLLVGQVARGMEALDKHIGTGDFAAGDTLTRADCTLVPALFMCESTLPGLGADNPADTAENVQSYWAKIKGNAHAARVIDEMARGLQARLDGTEKKMVEAAIAKARAEA